LGVSKIDATSYRKLLADFAIIGFPPGDWHAAGPLPRTSLRLTGWTPRKPVFGGMQGLSFENKTPEINEISLHYFIIVWF